MKFQSRIKSVKSRKGNMLIRFIVLREKLTNKWKDAHENMQRFDLLKSHFASMTIKVTFNMSAK